MKILTFRARTTLHTAIGEHKSRIVVNPGERVVLDDISAQQIISPAGKPANASDAFLLNYSDLGAYISKAPHRNWRDRNILFMRKRGIGDELCLTALPRFFAQKFGAKCYVLCHASTESIWYGNETVKSVVGEPLHLDGMFRADGAKPFYDHCFFFESVTEWDSESDQGNVYDTLFRLSGIKPETVDPRYKRPYLKLTAKDHTAFISWKEAAVKEYPTLNLEDGYVVHQLSTTNAVRNLPEDRELEVLKALGKCKKPVLVIDDKPTTPKIVEFLHGSENVFDITKRIPTLRLYFSLIAGASCVLAPDSSALHAAAAFDVPSIGFWGPFSPESRAKYYPNHHAIYERQLCVNSPCFNFALKLPANLCPRGDEQQSCEVFSGVTENRVTEALKERNLV